MSNKTILITGATGSLGAYLVRYYSRSGFKVIAHGRDKVPPKHLMDFAEYVSFDLTNDFELPQCDFCIHTAALSDDKASIGDLLPANEQGTKRLLEKLLPETVFIHISSSSVYLPQKNPISEEIAGKQNNKELSPYGLSKLKSEEVILNYTKNKSVFILRPRAFYGAGDRVILPRILKVVKKGKPWFLQRPGEMNVSVSLTHYSTLAHAIDCCLQSDLRGIHIYNVADKKVYVLIDIVRLITTRLYGYKLPEKKVPIWFMKALSVFKIGGITPLLVRSFTHDMVLNTTKIERELGFNPTICFEDQMEELANWVEKNGGVEFVKTGDRSLAWTADL